MDLLLLAMVLGDGFGFGSRMLLLLNGLVVLEPRRGDGKVDGQKEEQAEKTSRDELELLDG